MPEGSIDRAVASYRGLVEALAQSIARSPRAKQVGAEAEDLAQEGLIAVWQSLERGVNPMLVVENRMKDWIRYLGRQTPAEYETMLPLERLASVGRG